MAENRTFLWFSDIHLDPYYGTETAVLRDKMGFGENCQSPSKLTTHPLGDFGCDSPPELLDSLLQSAATQAKPDFVVITGDFVRHGNDILLPSPTIATQEILYTVSELIRTYLDAPVVPAVGNNDVTPDYYMDIQQPDDMLNMITRGLMPLWSEDNQEGMAAKAMFQEQFPQGGYYAHNVTSTITVLSLNTVLYATNRQPQYTEVDVDPLGQFQWMKEQLEMARQSQRNVFLIGHIPPTIGSYRHTQLWHEGYLETYYNMVQNYSDLVQAQLFGHIHTDEFRVHNTFPLFLTASFTPIYGSNPSYRVVTYDDKTGALLDYHVYYLDLTATSLTNATSVWQRGPSFTQAYGVPDMSLQSLKTIVEDLQNSTDTSIYWEAFLSRLHVYTHGSEVCDATCRKEWACTLSSMTAQQYHGCLKESSGRSGMVAALIVVVLAVGLAIIWGRNCWKRRHYSQTVEHHVAEEELPPLS
ncbi:sphingomyelinase-like phosphodiesterase 3b [Seminavis robusta]|uniref:Sphingomyelinase-like phosphodiesterase 3b n=1 Tax=Seminavis robusta TaxID=568900 RepID=A0A9N8H8G2_9STRA|nr:sphingomyelinase-like phosphodiesterase 3b [Seminavis robusta]|eukprot:Sro239_g095870.1 sphingomyelinase-like phosphodiesterase 3b (470) ;mRNA; r:37463-38872